MILRRIFILAFIFSTFVAQPAFSGTAGGFGAPQGLTGGCDGCLDKIDGDLLFDGAQATASDGDGVYMYRLDETSGLTESSPYIISPDSNAGNKRWICVNCGNQTQAGDLRTVTDAEAGALSSVVLSLTPGTFNTSLTNGTQSTNSSVGVSQMSSVGNSTDWSKTLSPGALFATPRYYTGSATRAAALGNGTQSISGWGFTPGAIEIQCIVSLRCWSLGYYDGANQGSIIAFASGTSTLFGPGGVGYAVNLYNSGNLFGTISKTADGFNIAWNINTGDWSGTTFNVRYKISR